ncbi:MAG: alkaline phosphatase [Ilumatobacteraceae bacterium]|nr:alkaline phosphatase [Ilumatobacteraceae bacterium]
MSGERLLLVDDEENLRSMLEAALRYNGFEVSSTDNGRSALAMIDDAVPPDLILLDVMLPDLDGFEVCRRLRSVGSTVPVVFLSARDSTDAKVQGLTIGGDDYLVKPFSLDELVARVGTVLRRAGASRQRDDLLTCADLVVDDTAHVVTRGGVEVDLTPTEYSLLRFLMINQGRVLSKTQILQAVWQYDFGDGSVVETYVRYLRRKIDSTEPHLIRTVRGVGYSLRDPK